MREKVLAVGFEKTDDLKKLNKEYLSKVLEYRKRIETLNKELRFI